MPIFQKGEEAMSKPSVTEQIKQLYEKRRAPKTNWELHQDAGYKKAIDQVLALVDRYVIIDKKDWQELANLLKNRPKLGKDYFYNITTYKELSKCHDHLTKVFNDMVEWAELVEAKFAELTGKGLSES